MGTKTLLSLALVALVGTLGYAWLSRASTEKYVAQPTSQASAQAKPQTQPTQPRPASKPAGYTMAQVAAHNSASSCWAAINGNVYNLTDWIDQHPGGPERILSLCGTDGSAAFNAQHGGQRRPAQELAQFLLGPLAQ